MEAQAEVDQFRSQQEALHQQKVASGSTGSVTTYQRLQQETDAEIATVQQAAQAKQGKVVELLLGAVTTA